MKVSVVVITENEEERIAKCLESVSWAEKVVVIDDYSEDKTREIARKMGAKVYKRRLDGDFAKQRNYGLDKARGEWVFFVDADEIVTPELAKEIKAKLSTSGDSFHETPDVSITRETSGVFDGFKIPRVDYLWGRELKYGEVGNTKIIRLGKKSAGKWKRAVHEYWEILSTSSGQVGELKNPLLHYPHSNVAQFLEDIRQYSQLHAQALQKEGVKANLFQILAFPAGKFLANYIAKFGFLDGTAGFVHAMMMSLHSFLARSQLWLMQHKDV